MAMKGKTLRKGRF